MHNVSSQQLSMFPELTQASKEKKLMSTYGKSFYSPRKIGNRSPHTQKKSPNRQSLAQAQQKLEQTLYSRPLAAEQKTNTFFNGMATNLNFSKSKHSSKHMVADSIQAQQARHYQEMLQSVPSQIA